MPRFVFSILAIVAIALGLEAKTDPTALYDLSIEANLAQPKSGKQATEISDFQNKQAKVIKEAGYITEMMRKREVIIVTIPAAEMFAPNDTVLTAQGETKLKPFLPMLKTADFYRMLLVMHTDNTGSSDYTDELSRARVEQILDYFEKNAKETDFVIPYAVGAERPIKDNNSVENRAYNRRLEIFLVPGEKMIDAAKDGSLSSKRIIKME